MELSEQGRLDTLPRNNPPNFSNARDGTSCNVKGSYIAYSTALWSLIVWNIVLCSTCYADSKVFTVKLHARKVRLLWLKIQKWGLSILEVQLSEANMRLAL
jgi:hypothetical protein